MHTLTVYKASAGSGKTFTLAVEYIRLLLEDAHGYDGVLAVTFTNKATEEMKMRILSTLYGLANSLQESEGYLAVLMEETGLEATEIRRRARTVLTSLLHNYHYFRVQTIDAFFQAVLRNLAKELMLTANLRVGLNTEQVVDQAVDDMVDTVADDKELKQVVMDYVNDNMTDGKNWNVISQIKAFGGNIFREHFKQNRQRMEKVFEDEKFFDNYKRTMRSIMTETEKRYREYGEEAMQILEAHGLALEDFSRGKSGVMGYFVKLTQGNLYDVLNKTAADAMEDAEKWVKKTHPRRAAVMDVVEQELLPLLQHAEASRANDARMALSAKKTLQHLNDLRLLKRIELAAHELNEAAQRFMLNDTQSLLHDIIEEGDAPFIFEKIGARLEHVMIDEFQDTSVVQWRNFQTLLRECMAQGKSNLIVGDVKQSIYRFRSGDWRLLNNIEREFREGEVKFEPKRTNYRSERNVIEFNNAFFEAISQIEVENVRQFSEARAEELERAYCDVKQLIPEGKKNRGHVILELLPMKGSGESDTESMEEKVAVRVRELLGRGVRQRDIAILVRSRRVIPDIAQAVECCMKEQDKDGGTAVKVVSDEAFRLDSSRTLQCIVGAMRLLVHPQEALSRALLENLCNGELPSAFTEQYNSLQMMTLYDLSEALLKIFQKEGEDAYISKFFDEIREFCENSLPVTEDFLREWDSEICAKTIEAAEGEGIRILTIHKSKGLEFKHVIIPYCNWSFNPPQGSLIWAEPTLEPFSELPMIPLECVSASSLEGTIYEEDGYDEQVQKIVDNLNLLYVVMTRAGESLYVIGERGTKEGNRSYAMEKAIADMEKAIAEMPDTIGKGELRIEGQEDKEGTLRVEYGSGAATDAEGDTDNGNTQSPSKMQHKDESKARNVFTAVPTAIKVETHSYENTAEYRQSNESLRFADDSIDNRDRERMIKVGMVLHQLFSTIRTLDDVEPVMERMEFDGMLYGEDVTREKLQEHLRRAFENTQVRSWFDSGWDVYNECTILTPEGEYRPDRVVTNGEETVVVDFKFGNPHKGYVEQVKRYMQLLRDMGLPGVKGYLWFVIKGEVVKIDG